MLVIDHSISCFMREFYGNGSELAIPVNYNEIYYQWHC